MYAHWDEERDKRRVEMMRGCKAPNSEEIIGTYEETGDLYTYLVMLCGHHCRYTTISLTVSGKEHVVASLSRTTIFARLNAVRLKTSPGSHELATGESMQSKKHWRWVSP
jgi:hypothetical protein